MQASKQASEQGEQASERTSRHPCQTARLKKHCSVQVRGHMQSARATRPIRQVRDNTHVRTKQASEQANKQASNANKKASKQSSKMVVCMHDGWMRA